jgi:hypothetical protein
MAAPGGAQEEERQPRRSVFWLFGRAPARLPQTGFSRRSRSATFLRDLLLRLCAAFNSWFRIVFRVANIAAQWCRQGAGEC